MYILSLTTRYDSWKQHWNIFTAFPYFPKDSQPKMRDSSCQWTSSSFPCRQQPVSNCFHFAIVFNLWQYTFTSAFHIHHNCPAAHEDCTQFIPLNAEDHVECQASPWRLWWQWDSFFSENYIYLVRTIPQMLNRSYIILVTDGLFKQHA
jgi:hypothetical protein